MKTRSFIQAGMLLAGLASALNPGMAPAQVTLDLQLYAGLSLTGAVGRVYAIQATTNVGQTNGWTCLAFIQLQATSYLWLDSTAHATGQRFYRAVATAPTNLVFIPPGTFRMGSPANEVDRYDNEGPQTSVTLTKGFYIGKYLVTQGDYLAVMGANPSHFLGDMNRPVEQVSWYDATNYCARRTQQEGAAGRIPEGCRYRLPTEAEWEYACRGWTSTRFYYGDDPGYANLADYAWYDANSGNTTHPVGQKLPNAWGLYDMAGNLFEWCQDWYGPLPGGSVIDPQGPRSGSTRVAHGGAWTHSERDCRAANRVDNADPAGRYNNGGFRVVLAPDQ